MSLKRLFDFAASAFGIIILLPAIIVVSICIKAESRGPIFFRQERVGQFGRVFCIHKFRTMVTDAERKGLQITVGDDVRITRVGGFLRKYKIDELAQLLDVLSGEMSLVGPRPEVPRYVATYPEAVREKVLSVKPGITDWASIEYKDENQVLALAADPQAAYVEQVLPVKLRYAAEYVDNRTFLGDIKIIFATLFAIAR